MIKPSCSKARRLVLESEGGRIESADALWLESHIQACTGCRHESRELESLLGAWRSAAPPRLTTGQKERIEKAVLAANVTDAANVASRRVQRTWRVPTIAAGIAATMAVVSLAMFWSKRQPTAPVSIPGHLATTAMTPSGRTAQVTHGSVHVYGPTGEARVLGNSTSVPWNTTLQTPPNTGCVLAVGSHATLALTPNTQVTLRQVTRRQVGRRHLRADTVVVVTRGTIALDVLGSDVHGSRARSARRFRVWIPGRGEVTTQGARLVVARGTTGVAVSTVRGWAHYGWTQAGTPQVAELEAGQRLTHRLDTVKRSVRAPDMDAGALLAGTITPAAPTRHHRRGRGGALAPQRPDGRDALAQGTKCATEKIQRTLARRDAMGALRSLEACRAAGQTSQKLRTLEARANLQAGRVRRAFNQYLAVAHSFRGSPAGQTALYSAGRLALTRLARKSQAKHLFEHYLNTYPKGAHRANVQQMLRRL
jgi:hypothetical protein